MKAFKLATKTMLVAIGLLIWQNIFANDYLLKPTGKYSVGFEDFRLVNGTLVDGSYFCPGKTDLLYMKDKNEKDFGRDNQTNFCRELMLRIYYPAVKKLTSSRAGYYAPSIHDIQERIKAAKVPTIKAVDIAALGSIKTFTVKNATIVNQKFPVLIYSPGAGVEAQQYENIITELVSHGYIVLALNNTFTGTSILFPDGRIVHNSKDFKPSLPSVDQSILNDILFVKQFVNAQVNLQQNPLAKFIPHMQLDHIGLLGHSIGAMASVHVVRKAPALFQAVVTLDAIPTDFGVRAYSPRELAGFKDPPIMRMFAAEWRNLGKMAIPKNAKIQLFSNNYYVLLSPSEDNTTYTNHMSYSDYLTLQYQPALKLYIASTNQEAVGTVDGWYEARLINDYILQFFNMYLKNKPSSTLKNCKAITDDAMLTCGH